MDIEEKGTIETPTEPKVEPTIEQKLESLQKENADLSTKLAEKDKGLRTAHETLTKKDIELKKRADLEDKIASLENMVKLSTAYMFENTGKTEEEFETAKTRRPEDLKKKFEDIIAQSEVKRKIETQRQEVVNTLSGLQSRADALGLTEDDDSYLEIKNLAVMATPDSIKLAERKLKKLEDTKEANKVVEIPKETEDERIEKKARELLEKRGLLKPENSKPTGTYTSFKEVEKAYGNGDISYKEYSEARKRENI